MFRCKNKFKKLLNKIVGVITLSQKLLSLEQDNKIQGLQMLGDWLFCESTVDQPSGRSPLPRDREGRRKPSPVVHGHRKNRRNSEAWQCWARWHSKVSCAGYRDISVTPLIPKRSKAASKPLYGGWQYWGKYGYSQPTCQAHIFLPSSFNTETSLDPTTRHRLRDLINTLLEPRAQRLFHGDKQIFLFIF